ncbi:hypothetical protein, partial [Actinocorallia libanotica]
YLKLHAAPSEQLDKWITALESDHLSIATESTQNAHTLWQLQFSEESKSTEFFQWLQSARQTIPSIVLTRTSKTVTLTHSEGLSNE